jgi:hypothetical protein
MEGNPPAGVLAAVCWIFKHGKRDDLLPFATPMLRWAQECTKKDQIFCLTHKFAMKLIQRIGETFSFKFIELQIIILIFRTDIFEAETCSLALSAWK